jgi:hypothetical protein
VGEQAEDKAGSISGKICKPKAKTKRTTKEGVYRPVDRRKTEDVLVGAKARTGFNGTK